MKNSEYYPQRPIWLVFDLSNGHAPTKRYVWWFDSRKAARDHIKFVKKQKNSVDLSPPTRFLPRIDWAKLYK